ncbi:MAG TPA: hypothetical protein VGH28_03005 [Polyangiaceae bacterium]|jgi:hypothetical protein
MQPYPYAPAMLQPQQKRRNPVLIALGGVLLLIALLAFAIFAYNAWQYSTAGDKLGDIEGAAWVVDLVKEAALKRMMVFGTVTGIFGLGGAVLGFFGLRKR